MTCDAFKGDMPLWQCWITALMRSGDKARSAFYYYEITEPKEKASLEHRYQTVILRSGKLA